MSPIRRLVCVTIYAPIPHLSPHSRHRFRRLHSQNKAEYPTPYHAHAHPLQITTVVTQHVTPAELMILLFALGILVALLCWLAWIIFTFVFEYVREKIDDYNIGQKAKGNARRREEHAPSTAAKTVQKVGSAMKHMVEGLTRSGGWQESEFGTGTGTGNPERRGLLQDVERDTRRYGYHEGTIYRDVDGDGTSESTGSGKTAVKHRDDCNGQCGQPRKRSVDI